MKTIKLNSEIEINLEKLIAGKLLVQANSGGGKSWLIRRLIEQSYGQVQIIVLDPEGEFSTLREKYDFVLAGKGGDTPADPKSAALLARRLLEHKVSAIIDLYELHPQERKHFVRLFLESMVNAPKELYHDVLVVLDEAHMFVPEKDESEAAGAVIDMASRGRKRGYSLVLATQRISKLAKDAAAECNNKLIGRTSLDIDRKRAADELGITSKEETLALRSLAPGEFFAFGPAISNEVVKVKVGDVKTSIPKAGTQTSVTAPTASILKILAKLADLPQEAIKEAKTIAELKTEIATLKRANTVQKQAPSPAFQQKIVEKAVKDAVSNSAVKYEQALTAWKKYANHLLNSIRQLGKDAGHAVRPQEISPSRLLSTPIANKQRPIITAPRAPVANEIPATEDLNVKFGAGERKVLSAIAQHEEGISREHLTIVTGYKRSTRDAYIQRLRNSAFIIEDGYRIKITESGIEKLGPDFERLPTGADLLNYHLQNLPEGEQKILRLLADYYPDPLPRETITELSGYQRSTRDAYIQRLSARQLVKSDSSRGVIASEKLFE